MDERTPPSAAFALRLVADLITALVLSGAMTKTLATVTVDQALEKLLEDQPEYGPALREIAGTLNAQIGMAAVELEALRRGEDGR